MARLKLQAKLFPALIALGMSIALPHFAVSTQADVVSHTQEAKPDNSMESPENQRMMRLIRIANGEPALNRFDNPPATAHQQATALTSEAGWFEEWGDELATEKEVPNIPEPSYFVLAGIFSLFAFSTRRKRSITC